jgi:hypothetical protein
MIITHEQLKAGWNIIAYEPTSPITLDPAARAAALKAYFEQCIDDDEGTEACLDAALLAHEQARG